MVSGIRQTIQRRAALIGGLLTATVLSLTACSGSDGTLLVGGVAPGLQNDGDVSSASDDFARPLYTANGVWFCSVTSNLLAIDDQIEFNANGSADFQRYGTVYWNRDLTAKRLTIHLPGGLPFVMHGIFASDQSLQFNVDLPADDTIETDEVYACVLSAVDS